MTAPAVIQSVLLGPKYHAGRFWATRLGTVAIVAAGLFAFHKFVTPQLGIYDIRLLVLSLLFATLATSLNLINGITGQFSIGHAAFYLIGAMTAGKLSLLFYESAKLHPILWLALMVLASAGAAAVAGLMVGLPSLRLKGDYLAVATLGFGEIVNVVLRNQDGGPQAITTSVALALIATIAVAAVLVPLGRRFLADRPRAVVNGGTIIGLIAAFFLIKIVHSALWAVLSAIHVPLALDSKLDTGGPTGLQSVPQLTEIWCILLLFIGTLAIVRNLLKSAHGLSFLSVREDELAADATGVSITRVKVQAFVIGAALAGMVGALFAHYNGSVSPDDFKMDTSFMLVAMVVIGGTGSITGAAVAGISMKLLEEGLRKVPKIPATEFYGLLIAAVVVFLIYRLLAKKGIVRLEGRQKAVWTFFGVLVCVGLAWLGYLTYGQDLSWVLKIALWTLIAGMLMALFLTPARKTALPVFGVLGVCLALTVFVGPFIGKLLSDVGPLQKLIGNTVYAASDLRWAMFSAALVLVMILKPTGLMGHHEFSWPFMQKFLTGRIGKAGGE